MRRTRQGVGGTLHANRSAQADLQKDPLSLIRSFDSEAIPTRPAKPSPLSASTFQGIPLDLLDRLRSFPLFLSAPDNFLAAIGSFLRPQLHNPHDYVLTEGDDAKAMFWLVRGALIVTSRDGESTYAELKPGAIFGEIGILMDVPRTATVIAKLRSLVVRLNKEDMQKVLPAYPQVERAIREEALERLAILERKKDELRARKQSTHHNTICSIDTTDDIVMTDNDTSSNHPPSAATTTTMTLLTSPSTSISIPNSANPLPRVSKRPRSMDSEQLIHEATASSHDHQQFLVPTEQQQSQQQIHQSKILVPAKKRKSPSPRITEALASSALGSASVNVRQLLTELPLFATLPSEILHFIGLNAEPRTYPPFTDIIKQGTAGKDVFFIVRGEVEVIHEKSPSDNNPSSSPDDASTTALNSFPSIREFTVKARLKPGQYFGEVTSLALAPRRTATVRSVSAVETLTISNDVLDELWERCTPDVRSQVERVARERLHSANDDDDTVMADADAPPSLSQLDLHDIKPPVSPNTKSIFSMQDSMRLEGGAIESIDPDPYLNIDLENVRSRSRRGSLAPPSPSHVTTPSNESDIKPLAPSLASPSRPGSSFTHGSFLSPLNIKINAISPKVILANKRGRIKKGQRQQLDHESQQHHSKQHQLHNPPKSHFHHFSDKLLCTILRHFDVYQLMILRLVCQNWHRLIRTSPMLLHRLDLKKYNRYVTDHVLVNIIAPFAGARPKYVDISNCFHVTDDGFQALANACAGQVITWKMKSVWDITGQAILDMANKARCLQEVDLSNCRKVGDNLLARIIGWVVPESSTKGSQAMSNKRNPPSFNIHAPPTPQTPSTSAIIGCPQLRKLILSYCKHITDRSMAHIATHASQRLEAMDLTRCTTITDAGFHAWSVVNFPRLTRLCLADCTYLTDNAIVWLTHAVRGWTWLELSFCCALSDISTEVLALGCPSLRHLNLAFCGSAVSDASLRVIARHLLELRTLSVRGCVRVTGAGVDAIVDGCERLRDLDISQCRNLVPWILAGGRGEVHKRRGATKSVRFCVTAGQSGGWESGLGLEGGAGGLGGGIYDDDGHDEADRRAVEADENMQMLLMASARREPSGGQGLDVGQDPMDIDEMAVEDDEQEMGEERDDHDHDDNERDEDM